MENEKLKASIIEMEKTALEEWNKGNPSGYLDIYASDITYFDPIQERRINGLEKMKVLYETIRGKVNVDKYEMIDPVVQLSGQTAVLSYHLFSHVGNDIWKWNCTEVFQLNADDQWKIIHNHWSLIQPQK
ncbi:MAG: nuclear transport factor 2 family protein [Bacteroidales bacterium]|nr:nuclear transport factor 2 family protein [Bacteroidales bacterium]